SLGLGIAVACCLAAYLFVAHNIEFDGMHRPDKVANIYKIHAQQESKTGQFSENMTIAAPLAPMAALEMPGINRFTRYIPNNGVIQNGEKTFSESFHFADSTFFDLFEYPLLAGNLAAFKDKFTIILNEKLATKLFSYADPIGKDVTVYFPNEKELLLTVGAVVKQIPRNNTFVYDAMIRFDHFADILGWESDDWSDWRKPSTFFELTSSEVVPQVNEQLAKYIPMQNKANQDATIKSYRMEPFLSNFNETEIAWGWVRYRISYVPLIIFGAMAFMILLIACFNLTNTSIAMSYKRLKEIGVRKAIGATRTQIISQFLTETTLTMLIALIVGYVFAKSFLLPEFTAMFKFGYGLSDLNWINLLLALLIVLFLASFLAGIYPALFNSRLNPVSLVKGSVKLKGTNFFTRSLMTVQFAVSVIFLIGGIVFFQNNEFMNTIDFGYDSDRMIAVDISSEKEYNLLAAEASRNPNIKHFAGTNTHISHSTYRSPVTVNQTDYQTMIMSMGKGYLKTIGLEVLQGNETDMGSQFNEEGNIMVNQAFLEKTGITDPLNQQITVHDEKRNIVGVVANHRERGDRAHMEDPFVFYIEDPKRFRTFVVNVESEKLADTYVFLQKTWQKNIPNKPFIGHFQEDILLENLRYGNSTMSKVFVFLTFLGTLLSLAGIYAMASLNIAKRTKEIGIRKVLGASIKNIIALVNREFVIILSMAALFGAVIGFFLITMMIDELYAYHVPVAIVPVVLCAFLIFICGFLVTSTTIFRVAIANPVKALKDE
ncbi:MAG: FtsX-like permease family protein, partial [Bacteroidota bacterium]